MFSRTVPGSSTGSCVDQPLPTAYGTDGCGEGAYTSTAYCAHAAFAQACCMCGGGVTPTAAGTGAVRCRVVAPAELRLLAGQYPVQQAAPGPWATATGDAVTCHLRAWWSGDGLDAQSLGRLEELDVFVSRVLEGKVTLAVRGR